MDPAPRPERGVEPAAPTETRDPLVVAHRGAWSAAPQNSLAALEGAIELGCDMVELDIRRTRDGRLVAVHEPRIQGTKVGTLDHAQLRARLGPGQAPSLAEVLEHAAGRIKLDIELKEDGYVGEVTRTVGEHLAPEAYVMTSFLPLVLAAVKEQAPATRTGLLLKPGGALAVERRLQRSRADFLAPHASLARAGLLAWAHERDLQSYVWTVNHRRVLHAMLDDRRVSAVITDRPGEALAHLASVRARARGAAQAA
jgi:glycerophosphoryl diester phosphodiesterase